MAAEYEVNIKINTQEIKTQLNEIDRVVKDIGKGGRSGGSKSGVGAGIAKQLSLFTADSIFGRGRITGTALKNVKLSWLGAFDEIQDVANTIGGRRSARLLNVKTSWGKAFEGLAKNAKVLELGGLNTQTSWTKALTGLQDNAKVLKLGSVNTQTSWTKALTGLQDNAKVLDIQNLNVRTSWGKALEQLGETAEIIAKNAATARAQFLAGAPIPGLAPGQTAGPARPPVQGAAFPVGGAAGIPGSPEFQRALEIGRFNSSPIQGAANIPGSPEAKRIRKQLLEQVGLGAGFPLLFGGGAGSILGGGLGGLTGSFGAQIAFSAIGQQIDQFIAGITETAKAFSSLEGVLALMSERSLFTSKSSEELAQQLENLGDVEALAELATIELASKIGSDGIEAFQDLETELDEFDRLVGHLMISLQAFLAGPLGSFLEIINATLGKKVTQGTIDRLAESLQDPADQTKFRAAAKERIGTELEIQGFGAFGLPRSAEVLKSAPLDLLSELSRDVAGGEFGESNLLSRPLRITRQDRETIKPKKDSAANDEERLQKRLDRLEEERKKVLEISRFRDQIAAAEAVGDDELVIRLQGEQQIAEIEASRLKALVGVTKQHERDAINIGKATEKLAAHRDTERELNALQATRAEANKKVISDLEAQNALLQAKLNGNLEEVQLEQELGNILEKNVGLDEERVRSLLDARNVLNEQVKVVENLDMIYDQIGQSIASGVVDTLSAAVDQTKSLADAAANTLRNIANILLQLGTNTLLTSTGLPIFANLKGFANGGSPPVGRPSIVGERGPELFVPKSAGTIVPNHALGGANVVVNVDASGSQAQGSQPNAKALGAAIGAAVQAELVKQKRPGGLLS